jgi:xylan 1,4-beta-xylosidase
MFGIRAKGGINKPSYYAYGLLHKLGNERLANASKNVIVTKTANGGLAIATWNLVDPDQHGSAQVIDFDFHQLPSDARVSIRRVDADHGNVLKEYSAMGEPLDPTQKQVDELNRETALPSPEETGLQAGKLRLRLTPNTLALIEIQP